MKKFLLSLLPFFMAAVCVCSISACSSDDDEKSKDGDLIGWWATEEFDSADKQYRIFQSLHFVNSNTVVVYDCVIDKDKPTGRLKNLVPFPEKSGWFYEKGDEKTFIYTRSDSQIFIKKGDIISILTIMNGVLVREGYSLDSEYNYRKIK